MTLPTDYEDSDVEKRFADFLLETLNLLKQHRNNAEALVKMRASDKKAFLLKMRRILE